MKNAEIRSLIVGKGVRYKELAETIHVSQSTLSMWLSNDLTEYRRTEILKGLVLIGAERDKP